MIACPECAAQVSARASACPKCGAPMDAPAKRLRGIFALFFALFLGTIFWFFRSGFDAQVGIALLVAFAGMFVVMAWLWIAGK
jgi:hypothetical protein